MFALFSGIFKLFQKAVQPISKSKIGVLMKTAVSRDGLAAAGNVIGRSAEYAYTGAGVVNDHFIDSITNQRS